MPEKPKKNESKNEFISRCVKDLSDNDEYKDQDQRLAVCYSMWERKDEKLEDKIDKYLKEQTLSSTIKGYKTVTKSPSGHHYHHRGKLMR